MPELNQKYQTEITAFGSNGSGICRIDGMTVFVDGVCEGDFCEIQITKINASYAFARLERIITPSVFRTNPSCTVFGKCGGCQLMHICYEKQLALKKQFVFDALTRIGCLDVSDTEICDTVGMNPPERYRNKMVFPIGKKADGRICGGFYAPKSHHIISLFDCRLGDSFASQCLAAVLSYIKKYQVSVYDEKTHKGLIRRLFVRCGYHSKEAMLVISANGSALPKEDALIRSLLSVSQEDYHIKSILLNENRERNNLVLGEKNRVLYGNPTIFDTLCGIAFEISPNSFYQVNPVQTEKLYQTALDFAELNGKETVLDLYCGIGTISLCAARRAARVIGVEIVPQAIENAKQNAERNHIQNAEFYTGDAQIISEKLLREGFSPDVIFLDPPRKGCDAKTIESVLTMNPKRIVYVSCNPSTLARDLQTLAANGYALIKVQPVDMFPHTLHVECVVLMSREDN